MAAGKLRRPATAWAAPTGLLAAMLLLFNLSVAAPVGLALHKDPRNAGVVMMAYRSFGLHPAEITLDLWSIADDKAPLDLLRSLFQASQALQGRRFSRVVLARSGHAVFVISGEDFASLGGAYSDDENPIYLVRTLPEKLRRPDGTPAFGAWSGGWLGVVTRQLQDVTAFAASWAHGQPIDPSPDPA